MSPSEFYYHRLDAYQLARSLAKGVHEVAGGVPRGNATLVDQMRRAANAIPLLIAEGASRRSIPQKRQRFIEARGEAAEAAAALELLADLGLISALRASELMALAERISMTLTGLIRSA